MMNAKRSSRAMLTRYAFLVPMVLICLLTFSFSKAELVKKSKTVYLTLAKSVEKIDIIATIDDNVAKLRDLGKDSSPIKKEIKKHDTVKIYRVQINGSFTFNDTAKKRVSDTNKFKVFNMPAVIITIDSNRSKLRHNPADTGKRKPIYVIDGKFVNSADVDKVMADEVKSIDVQNVDKNEPAVVVINTTHAQNPVTSARINGQPMKIRVYDKKLNLADDTNKIMFKEVVVMGYRKDSLQRRQGYPINAKPGDNIAGVVNRPLPANLVLSRQGQPGKVINFVTAAPALNNLSDKMFIIDGKVASEKDMKKLKAFDIERMFMRNDEETKATYGEKGKNGVVFIVTKKQAK